MTRGQQLKRKAPVGPRVAAVDLFCGGGGMTLGAMHAGVDVLFAVERCSVAAATYRQNFPDH